MQRVDNKLLTNAMLLVDFLTFQGATGHRLEQS
jgi:hypothetical protein